MILLDTHIWHWWVNQIPGRLSSKTIELIEIAEEVAVSAISCFELAWLLTIYVHILRVNFRVEF